ncbi:MAG: hypothetical protein OXE50_15315 [Chloroflexi bacterium]|nr:hypothetical protein [Chloroflexota bacterium]
MQQHRRSNLIAVLLGDANAANELRRSMQHGVRQIRLAVSALVEFIQDVQAIAKESEEALQIPEREAREQLQGKLWD